MVEDDYYNVNNIVPWRIYFYELYHGSKYNRQKVLLATGKNKNWNFWKKVEWISMIQQHVIL